MDITGAGSEKKTSLLRKQNCVTVSPTVLDVVAFAGAGQVFKNGEFDINEFKPNFGGGIRYFYDPAKGLSIRLDYGVGEKAAS